MSPKAPLALYGLPRCGTCVKAQAWLKRRAIAFEFIDYRAQPIDPLKLGAWADALGWPALINRQSTTWRQLLPTRKNPASAAEYLLLLREYPTLLKRPVAGRADGVLLGFSDALYTRSFGPAAS